MIRFALEFFRHRHLLPLDGAFLSEHTGFSGSAILQTYNRRLPVQFQISSRVHLEMIEATANAKLKGALIWR